MFSKHDLSRVFKALTMLSANGNKKLSMSCNLGNNRTDTLVQDKVRNDQVTDTIEEYNNLGNEKDIDSKFIGQRCVDILYISIKSLNYL